MILKSIELQGFKSFPDKITLDFSRGVTAVVGPNGSGKSNISDAVRWVLGEQSTKSLRGGKMEDVIFSGTATRKAQGFAMVTLAVDNSDRRLVFDNDEILVTRKYYRSGESEYMINRATVRLKDVHELFMDTGLGRDGYSIIGQGKIADIVSSRCEDRREIFEEAAGISRFRYRKIEAERRLAKAEDNLLRLRDILSEIEGRIGPLAEQSEKAQRFLEYAGEKRELEIGLWLHKLERSKDELRQHEHKIAVTYSEYNSSEQELSDLERTIEEMFNQTGKITVEIDELRRQAASLEENAAKTEGQIAVVENTMFHNGETLARLRREAETLGSSDQVIEREKAAIAEKIAQNQTDIAQKQQNLSQLEQRFQQATYKSEEFGSGIEGLKTTIQGLTVQSADARVALVTAQSSLAEINARGETLLQAVKDKKAQTDALEVEQSNHNDDLDGITEKSEEIQNALKGYELILSSKQHKLECKRREADRLSLEISEKNSRAAMLAELEKNMEGFAHSVKAVMKEAARGALSGVHGPVSKLIKVPQEYAVAMETALGAAMQNVVVGNENDAKSAISYLKRNNLGRATFLPIASVTGRSISERGLDSCFGFLGYAVDLIEYESKYAQIVSSLLGKTAVCEDLDCATAIAKKYSYRFRIVTLDGQIINAGGSFTGGSTARTAGILTREPQIQELKRLAEKLTVQLDSHRQTQKQLEEEAAQINAQVLAARAELSTANEDKIRLLGEIKRVGELLSAARSAYKELELERSGAGKRIAELERIITKAQARETGLAEHIAAAEEQLAELTGSREELISGREVLSEELAGLKLNVALLTQDTETQKATLADLDSQRAGAAGQLRKIEEEISAVELNNAGLNEQISGLKAKAAAEREAAHDSLQKAEGLNQSRSDSEQKVHAMRALERDKASRLETLSGQLARMEERKASMMREYDETVKRMYDEYEITRREAEQTGIKIEEPQKAARRLNELKSKIRELGNVNLAAIEEYQELHERYTLMTAQIDDIQHSREELHRLILDLTQNMSRAFVEKFNQINENFTRIFSELFGGGNGSLSLSEPDNVLESGIELNVQPPGKNVKNIDLFSGGEKALVAIALYFSILRVSPSPFCVLDEIEAALDEVNVDRFAAYLRKMADNTQFIAITHRRGTMEEADVLYGVTMQEEGVSKLLKMETAELAKEL